MEEKFIEPMKNGKKAAFIISQTAEENIGISLSMTGLRKVSMLCRKPFRTSARPSLPRSRNPFLATLFVLGLAGCGGNLGSFDTPQSPPSSPPGARLLAAMLGMKRTEAAGDGPASPGAEDRHIYCPEVVILEGTEASRAYAGILPSNANLRYQYSLTETARECKRDGDELTLKIGVAGKVLLGPVGSPGSFTVPVRMAILRKIDNEPEVSKLYHTTVTVGQSETETDFTIISELLHVPFVQDHAEADYAIRVGIDEGPGRDKNAGRR